MRRPAASPEAPQAPGNTQQPPSGESLVGGGLFRSNAWEDYYTPRPARSQTYSLEGYHNAIQSGIRGRDGVKFGLTNRGDRDYKNVTLNVAFMNGGKRVGFEAVTVPDVAKGATVEVVARYRGEFSTIEVRLASDAR